MINDKNAYDSYRKLLYFFKNQIEVHFKDFDDIFYNGFIIDLSEDKLTLVLNERVKGTIPILLEFINPDSIVKCERKEGWIFI